VFVSVLRASERAFVKLKYYTRSSSGAVAAQTFSGPFNLDEKSRSPPPLHAALTISTKGQFHLALKKAAAMRSDRQTPSYKYDHKLKGGK
jgi:hypothetical protein